MKTNIEELKRLAEAATPGPWQSGGDWIEVCDETAFDDGVLISISNSNSRACWDDLAYIAAANPAAVLELIRQRDELLESLKDAREMVSDWAGYASPYFQEKHDIDGDMKKLDAAIARMEC